MKFILRRSGAVKALTRANISNGSKRCWGSVAKDLRPGTYLDDSNSPVDNSIFQTDASKTNMIPERHELPRLLKVRLPPVISMS